MPSLFVFAFAIFVRTPSREMLTAVKLPPTARTHAGDAMKATRRLAKRNRRKSAFPKPTCNTDAAVHARYIESMAEIYGAGGACAAFGGKCCR